MIEKTEAIVLKSMRYRETSRIVTFYSDRFGKISGIAKGARSTKSKFGSSLEPLAHVALVLYKKEQRDLHLVSQCDLLRYHKNVNSDMDRLPIALAMIELLNQVTHEEEQHHELFVLLRECLAILEISSRNFFGVFLAFALRMAALFGYRPDFQKCLKCGSLLSSEAGTHTLFFHAQKGGFYCGICSNHHDNMVDKSAHRRSSESKRFGCEIFGSRPVRTTVPAAKFLERLSSVPVERLPRLTFDGVMGNELHELVRLYLQSHFEDVCMPRSLTMFHTKG